MDLRLCRRDSMALRGSCRGEGGAEVPAGTISRGSRGPAVPVGRGSWTRDSPVGHIARNCIRRGLGYAHRGRGPLGLVPVHTRLLVVHWVAVTHRGCRHVGCGPRGGVGPCAIGGVRVGSAPLWHSMRRGRRLLVGRRAGRVLGAIRLSVGGPRLEVYGTRLRAHRREGLKPMAGCTPCSHGGVGEGGGWALRPGVGWRCRTGDAAPIRLTIASRGSRTARGLSIRGELRWVGVMIPTFHAIVLVLYGCPCMILVLMGVGSVTGRRITGHRTRITLWVSPGRITRANTEKIMAGRDCRSRHVHIGNPGGAIVKLNPRRDQGRV